MTTEDDFQAALDANPDDWQTRLVFADWLEDRNDPRAEGYRALGLLRRIPVAGGDIGTRWGYPGYVPREYATPYSNSDDRYEKDIRDAALPDDWHNLIPKDGKRKLRLDDVWRCRLKRRESEDAAALAFAKLPAARRIELLAVQEPARLPEPKRAPPKKRKKK